MNMHQIVSRFAVGEIWRDDTTRVPQRIVAITDNEDRPIITQDEDGEVSSYSRTGRYHIGNGKYDLTTLVSGHKTGKPIRMTSELAAINAELRALNLDGAKP